jgi:carboxypeptidase C (cathepsin A)
MPSSRFRLVATLIALVAAPRLASQEPGNARDTLVRTHHQITVGGRVLKYTAVAGLLPIIDNDAGEIHARMFFVAYVLDGPRARNRPLTFLWNGGPGSSSSQVHVLGFGPKRLKTADAYPIKPYLTGPDLQDNQETWLDQSDLIFVDPVGTGYSRPTKPEYSAEFYNQQGDIESVAEFIRVYRTRFDTFDAPLFLAGESYGVTRAMGVAEALERRRTSVTGVILISNGIQMGQAVPAELNTALVVPRLTAAAFYHKKLAPDLLANLDATLKQSETWARTQYAPMLARRDSLSPLERSAVITQLMRFTGADSTIIDLRTLAISPTVFTSRLLRGQQLELGRYDTRMTAPIVADTGAWDPRTDPSLRPVLDLMLGTSVPLIRYLRDELGYKSDLLYQGPFGEGYPPPVAARGDWMSQRWNRAAAPASAPAPNATASQSGAAQGGGGRGGGRGAAAGDGRGASGKPPLRAAMDTDPHLRVLVLGGLYDTVVQTCSSIDEAIARLDASIRSRISDRCYAGGHMMYTDREARQSIKRDVSAFMRAVAVP